MTNSEINSTMNLKEISYNLKNYRKSKKIPIKYIIKETGLAYSTIRKIENYDPYNSYNIYSLSLYINSLGLNLDFVLKENPVKDM